MYLNNLLIILGNQLFPINEIKKTNVTNIFMSEDFNLCTNHKHHKLKILMFFIAMREYKDELIKNGFKVFYHSIEEKEFKNDFEDKLSKVIKKNKINQVNYFDIEDHFFEKKMNDYKNLSNINWKKHESPMFIYTRDKFSDFQKKSSTLRLANFYKLVRKDLNILIDKNKLPIGGKWSFDEENRKKLPKDITLPKIPPNKETKYSTILKININKHFSNHPGKMENLWMPTNRKDALIWLKSFFKYKLKNFGTYEDAINSDNNFLFHSGLSPLLNLGLLTPIEIIEQLIKYCKGNNVPLNSLEGFIRQIIGWREFIRGIYHTHGEQQIKSNFWNHNNKLTEHWYNGTTGIAPLDDAILDCINYGYTHHIPRLMIIANIMTLSRINPLEIYKWFMEMFVDSSDWVMVPNVFGMGTFADGGIFATKPYTCGSNYIIKMSNYKKGQWCDIVDGLYWSFMHDNKSFFKSNPRLSLLVGYLDRMDASRKNIIFLEAKKFINSKTLIK